MKILAQIQNAYPGVIVEPDPYTSIPPVWIAVIFLIARLGIPLGIAILVLGNKQYSLTRKLIISFTLVILFAFTFYLEYYLYGNINILRLFPRSEGPSYVYPEFT